MSDFKRKFVTGAVAEIGERQVRVQLSSGDVDRQGDIVEQRGAVLNNYARNPIVLWQHDPSCPIGTASDIRYSTSGNLTALVEFAAPGKSSRADEICGLVKSGVVSCVSIGFMPLDETPMDSRDPYGPQRIKSWELLEISFVSIPANPAAGVIQRRFQPGRLRAKPAAAAPAVDRMPRVADYPTSTHYLAAVRAWEQRRLCAAIEGMRPDPNGPAAKAARRRTVEALEPRD